MDFSFDSLLRGGTRGAAKTSFRAYEFVIAMPHASACTPPWISPGTFLKKAEEHEKSDIGSLELGQTIASILGAEAIAAQYSRLVIDMNRNLHDISVIPAQPVGLRDGDLAARSRLHRDYHQEIKTKIEGIEAKGSEPILIDLHSFTRVFDDVVREVDIGVVATNASIQQATMLVECLRTHSDRAKVRVRSSSKDRLRVPNVMLDEPYSGAHPGAFTSRHYGEQGTTVITLEICNDLLSNSKHVRRIAHLLALSLQSFAENSERPTSRAAA